MHLLGHASTPDKLQMVVDQGTIDYHVSAMDYDGTDVTPYRQRASGIGASTTDICNGAGAGVTRRPRSAIILNRHATLTATLDFQVTDGTTVTRQYRAVLAPNESLTFNASNDWTEYDALGQAKESGITVATQADMEAGVSLDFPVTPGRQHLHPGHPKAWLKCGLTANILASYNITSLADTGTGAVTVTIATDFASAEWSCTATIALASTTLAQSCTYDAMAAGTVILRSVVEAGSAADPVSWSMQACGDHA